MTNILFFRRRTEHTRIESTPVTIIIVDKSNRHALSKRCPFIVPEPQRGWLESFERRPLGFRTIVHVEGKPVHLYYSTQPNSVVELIDELHAEHADARWIIALKDGSPVDEHVRRFGRHVEQLPPPPIEPPKPKLTKPQREQRAIERECREADRRYWQSQRPKRTKSKKRAKKKASGL